MGSRLRSGYFRLILKNGRLIDEVYYEINYSSIEDLMRKVIFIMVAPELQNEIKLNISITGECIYVYFNKLSKSCIIVKRITHSEGIQLTMYSTSAEQINKQFERWDSRKLIKFNVIKE